MLGFFRLFLLLGFIALLLMMCIGVFNMPYLVLVFGVLFLIPVVIKSII